MAGAGGAVGGVEKDDLCRVGRGEEVHEAAHHGREDRVVHVARERLSGAVVDGLERAERLAPGLAFRYHDDASQERDELVRAVTSADEVGVGVVS